MSIELQLTFTDATHVMVALLGPGPEYSPPAGFTSPLKEADLKELRWYLEDYGTSYAAEPDDARALTVQEQLPHWGTHLFTAVFKAHDKADELFRRFRDTREEGRVLSVAADQPAVLSLPWELLHTPGGTFLVNEQPPISIRRGLPSAGQGRPPKPRDPKPNLHLLFIISRPDGASFIDPRRDADAVLTALQYQKQQRVEVEFLRPPTLKALRRRLRDTRLPKVDIIHFDGHGIFAGESSFGFVVTETFSKVGSAVADRQQGWLLFEDEEGGKDLVSAQAFGEMLFRNHAGLVVLSACKSAVMSSEDAMSGTAARLVHAGIPAVIAMTHSVLVSMAEQLFAEFYRSLFQGRTVARSLDEARRNLFHNPARGIRLRGADNADEFKLELHDWFLPTLYQSGLDMALLSTEADNSPEPYPAPLHNLPKPQPSGFFGRSKELWRIERAFGVEDCRRFSITGFGGQGKTALALEAGRWLLRTGLFQRVCMISYAAYQGSDPVSMAIAFMSATFEQSLIDADAARASLAQTPTLLILDSLESLAADNTLGELLDAAVHWSEAGASRVLLTSRQPDCKHPGYPLAGDFSHQSLALQGLQAGDSVDWFDSLRRLPPRSRFKRPRRDVLLRLFGKVGFHPLSISLLAQQLKQRGPAEVGERLEALLKEQPLNQADRSLLASLELSIEQLPKRCRKLLPRLGVFNGGCLEEMIENVIGIEEADWQELRNHLLLAGLLQAERVPETDMTFLRFHPTLAPALWQRLGKEEQDKLLERYWQAYHKLSVELYHLDDTNPYSTRVLAQHELSNLLRAVHAALQSGNSEKGVDFADKVNRFLRDFGMHRDYQALTEAAAKTGGTVGSQAWFVSRSNLGEQLYQSGQFAAAEQVFADILAGLEETLSYNRSTILHRLGRCCEARGQPAQAEQLYRQELFELASLEQSDGIQRLTSSALTDLADVLRDQRRYGEAKEIYQAGLKIMKELGNTRSIAVVTGQLGTLSLMQGYLTEAEEQYKEALFLFQRINEPASEAVLWHQLGLVYQDAEQWEAAEQAYRQSARLKEEQDLLAGSVSAGASWQQLAQVCTATGRVAEAEQWYSKALVACRTADDRPGMARILSNLADLLTDDPARLNEARSLAEEGLAISETLDPTATEIWKSYNLLSHIATQQGDSSRAAAYRAKAERAFAPYASRE